MAKKLFRRTGMVNSSDRLPERVMEPSPSTSSEGEEVLGLVSWSSEACVMASCFFNS